MHLRAPIDKMISRDMVLMQISEAFVSFVHEKAICPEKGAIL
jgi:hypothetical protein